MPPTVRECRTVGGIFVLCESSPVNRKNLIRYQIPSARGYFRVGWQVRPEKKERRKETGKSFCILALLKWQRKNIS